MAPDRIAGLDGAGTRPRPRRTILWIGGTACGELAIARQDVEAALRGIPIVDMPAPHALGSAPVPADVPDEPVCIVLASDRAGLWNAERVLGLLRRWPLSRLVAVTASLGDGRRRSGPPMPGIEEIPWHDLGGRLGAWFADLEAGLPGSLGLPATARREDRFLDAPTFAPHAVRRSGAVAIGVVARDPTALEGVVEMVEALGHRVERVAIGRPPIDTTAPLLVWDACALGTDDLEWLRLLVANRPGLDVVILESFPRGDVAAAALRAGASAVLGRPVNLETLAGTIRRTAAARKTG